VPLQLIQIQACKGSGDGRDEARPIRWDRPKQPVDIEREAQLANRETTPLPPDMPFRMVDHATDQLPTEAVLLRLQGLSRLLLLRRRSGGIGSGGGAGRRRCRNAAFRSASATAVAACSRPDLGSAVAAVGC
jgi:hypothetical protein